MSIRTFTTKMTAQHRAARQRRELSRAIAGASTPSLRQELLSLTAYDNR